MKKQITAEILAETFSFLTRQELCSTVELVNHCWCSVSRQMPFPRYSLIFLHIYIRNSTVLTSPNLQKCLKRRKNKILPIWFQHISVNVRNDSGLCCCGPFYKQTIKGICRNFRAFVNESLKSCFIGSKFSFYYFQSDFKYKCRLTHFLCENLLPLFDKCSSYRICGPEVGIKKGSLAGTPLLSLPVLQQCRELRLFVVKMDWTYGNVLKTNAMFTVDEIISWLHYTNTPTEIDKNEAGKKFTAERKLDLDRSSFNGFLVRDIIDKAAQIFLNDRRRHSYSLTFLDFNGPAIYLENLKTDEQLWLRKIPGHLQWDLKRYSVNYQPLKSINK